MQDNHSHNIPFQVENLLQNMMNKGERPHIRDNYRSRLSSIRDVIDKSIREYDNEMSMSRMVTKRKKA